MSDNIRQVSLDDIRVDPGLQCRVSLDADHVESIRFAIRKKREIDAPVLYDDGETKWLSDGAHRIAGYRAEEWTKIPCEVRKGTRRDALLNAVGSNHDHGLPRSNADKRKAVKLLLEDEEWSKWSNRGIADACNVDDKTVAKVREELASAKKPRTADFRSSSTNSRRRGADGVERKVPEKILCDRCRRVGPTKDCQGCEVMRREAKNGSCREPGEDDEDVKLPVSVRNALADTWHLDTARQLSQIQVQCKKAFNWSAYLDSDVMKALKEAEEFFLAAVPKKLCDKCMGAKKNDKGKPCLNCKGSGYLSAAQC